MYTSLNMLAYSKWLSLPLHTRIKIATTFKIPKLRSTHVANDQILDDGYNVNDIEQALSVESLQEYLGIKESDMLTLFNALVDKIEGKESPKPVIQATPEATPIPIEVIKNEPIVLPENQYVDVLEKPEGEIIPVHEKVVKISLNKKKNAPINEAFFFL